MVALTRNRGGAGKSDPCDVEEKPLYSTKKDFQNEV